MSSFTTPLIVESLPDGRHWKLISSFVFYYDDESGRHEIKVPEGFITDFASTPRILWSIFPPTGRYGKAAVVHDFCYKTACCPRKKCDRIFLEGMKVLSVPKWKRHVMYLAVRLFGSSHYAKSKDISKNRRA